MMMSCDWHRVVNKSGADLWQLERPSSYPAVAVAARRAAKLQAHGKVEQLPEISQSESQWRAHLGQAAWLVSRRERLGMDRELSHIELDWSVLKDQGEFRAESQ